MELITQYDEVVTPFEAADEADGISDAYHCARFQDFSVQTIGPGGGEVQASLEPENPTHWVKVADLAADTITTFCGLFTWLRFVHDSSGDEVTILMRRRDSASSTF